MRDARAQYIFFSNVERDAGVIEQVRIGHRLYRIEGGRVFRDNSEIDGIEAIGPLRLAYEKTVATRAPLFGLAGTDPKALSKRIDELTETVQKLATAQRSVQDAQQIQSSLYPLRFLKSLSTLEEARQSFIASGSDVDAITYERAISRALVMRRADAADFTKSLEFYIGTSSLSFPTLNGSIETKNMLAVIRSIRDDTTLSVSHAHRIACFDGDVGHCDARDIRMPTIVGGQTTPNDPALALDVRSLADEALATASPPENPLIELTTSTCTGSLPAPYTLSETAIENIVYVSDRFFMPTTDVNGPVSSYLRDAKGITLLPFVPITFYACPDVQHDLGTVWAVQNTALYARSHPTIASDASYTIRASGSVVRESDAEDYVRAALTNPGSLDITDREQLIEIAVMLDQKNARFDYLIEKIAQVDSQDLVLLAQGVPFDMSARTLFLTHSAFPSLYLAHKPGSTTAQLRSHARSDLDIFFSKYVRYSELRHQVPRAVFVENIRKFLAFEGLITPQSAE